MKHSCSPGSVMLLLLLATLVACASTQPYQTRKAVTSIAFSPDQMLLAFANTNEIQVLEINSNRRINTLSGLLQDPEGADPQLFRHGVGDSMVFLDNTHIASTGMGGLVSIWDVRSGRRLSIIDPLPGEEFASTIDYSPATHRLAIGTSAGQILLTTLNANDDLEPLIPLSKLESYVWDLQFSRDGHYLASASLMPRAPANIESGGESADMFAQMYSNEDSDNAVEDPVSTPPDQSNVFIWDAERREKVGDLTGATSVFKMSLVPGETALLTAGEKVQIWEFLTQKQLGEISDPSMVMQAIGMGSLAVLSVASLSAGILTPMDFMGNTLLNAGFPIIPTGLFIRNACARMAAISPDGHTIVSTTWGPTLNVMAVIDRETNKVVEKWTADSVVCDMQFSHDGKHLVAATSRGVFIFDTTSWKKKNLKDLVVEVHK